jgi:UDP-glucose-4-epimerase GalE
MTRILVIGGAGYVGSHCVKAAAAVGHDCVVYDSLLFGHRDFVRWGPLIQGDVRDRSALVAAMRQHRIEAVMHFAALAYVGQSMTDPARYYDVNVNGTRTLLDAMVEAGIRTLVFSSTCAVYGEPGTVPITEATLPRPINPYGFTKLVCERMIEDYGRAYGICGAKLRYFNAAGADPEGEIGEDHNPETHLIPLVLDAAMGRRPAISVFGDDYPTADGTAVRDYIHVADLAAAHVKALGLLLEGKPGFTVNLGTGSGISVAELIAAARQVTGRGIPTMMAPRREGDPAVLVADSSAAQRLLGWRAERVTPAAILIDAWRWHQRRFAGH